MSGSSFHVPALDRSSISTHSFILTMLLIAFATLIEAKPTLDLLQATVIKTDCVYLFEKGYLLITGIGSLAAATAVTPYLPLVNEMWNFGVAGTLQEEAIGSYFSIQQVSKLTYLPPESSLHVHQFTEKSFPSLSVQPEGAHLLSSDFPVHNSALKLHLSQRYQLIDMEGYGIAFAARQAKKACSMGKIVSDFSSCHGQKLIAQHLEPLSHQLASIISEKINTYILPASDKEPSCCHPSPLRRNVSDVLKGSYTEVDSKVDI